MKTLVSPYTFNAAAKTIGLPQAYALEQLLLITNVTTGTIIFNFSDPALGGSISGTTLTLDYDTTGMSSTDKLQIFVDTPIATATDNPAQTDPALPVVQKPVDIWVASFADVGASLVSPKFTQRRLGTGVGVSQSAGNLLITTGTTARSEFLARSTRSFNGAFIQRHKTILSQRIANQNFAVLLADSVGEGLSYNCTSATVVDVTLTAHGFTAQNVGQFMMLGGITENSGTAVPGRYAIASIVDANTIRFTVAGWATGTGTLDLFGWNYYRTLYNGTTPTSMLVDAQRQGWASGDITATTTTTASPGVVMQTANDGRSAYWTDSAPPSATLPVINTRATRFENLPDVETQLYVYLWSFNGSTAPASTTTWTLGFVSVEDVVNNPVYLAGVRQMGANTAPLPIAPTGTFSISGTVTATLAASSANVGQVGLLPPTLVADVASAALATTTTTAAFTPASGTDYEINIPVTVVSGTNPTLDVVVQESDDGTNWFDVYHFPRITTTGMYRSPKITLKGRQVRYVQTVGGTTPSFTRAINRLQGQSSAVPTLRRIFDRSLNTTQALNSTTTTAAGNPLNVQECTNLQLVISSGAITTTAPALQLQASEDGGVSWFNIGTPLTAVANSVVQSTLVDVNYELVRAIVTTAGIGATLNYVAIKGF